MIPMAPEAETEVQVWDIFVRVFHWTLVAGFVIAYASGDDFMTVHIWAGYLVGALVLLRVIWGVVGTRYARFSSFLHRPRTVLHYTRDLLRLGGQRYLGHSPAGGAMVITLLVMILLIVLTGLIALAMLDSAGPLAGYLTANRPVGRIFKEVHEVLSNLTLALVLVHICGVLWASFVHGENLIRAMWNGRKRALHDH